MPSTKKINANPAEQPNLITVYREMLWVSLGPYAQQLPRQSWTQVVGNYFRALLHIGKVVKDWLLYGVNMSTDKLQKCGEVWLMIGSKNNIESLKFVKEAWSESKYIALNKKVLQYGKFHRLLFHHSILYWYKLPYLISKLHPTFGKLLFQKFHDLFKNLGKYEAAIKILRRFQPRMIIFTNDHHPDMRAMLAAANHLGIRTAYLQHASVSELFPPLRFDLNLLEGIDSLKKYERCGRISGTVQLIGMPKFDHFVTGRNFSKKVERIGICANWLDDVEILCDLIHELSAAFPGIQLSFRPHPRDDRHFDLPPHVQYSNPRQEPIFEFLNRQDLLIAGDTSTHLEAVLLNIFSVYYRLNPHYVEDYYNYVKNGLVDHARSVEELLQIVKDNRENRPVVYKRAQYYNAVTGTLKEGKSTQLALEYLKKLRDR